MSNANIVSTASMEAALAAIAPKVVPVSTSIITQEPPVSRDAAQMLAATAATVIGAAEGTVSGVVSGTKAVSEGTAQFLHRAKVSYQYERAIRKGLILPVGHTPVPVVTKSRRTQKVS